MRILLVEDDTLLAQALVEELNQQRYAVDLASDGESGWLYSESTDYDLIVSDIDLPNLNGIKLCQRLRQRGYTGPLLLLTAKDDPTDIVIGLDSGADDYLVKPCTVAELLARIRALLRRPTTASQPTLEWGELTLDPSTCEVKFQGNLLALAPKEYSLLELFLRYPTRVFSSSAILDHLWAFEDPPGEDTVRAHIKRLRQKLKKAGAENVIETVYGLGYRLRSLPEPSTQSASPVASDPDPQSSTDSSTQAQARTATALAWTRFRPLAIERLTILEQSATALQTGSWSATQHKAAEQAAHKLAGSLGMFGLTEASAQAKRIEQWLNVCQPQTDQFGNIDQIKHEFSTLVAELAALLSAPPETDPSPESVTDTRGDRQLPPIDLSSDLFQAAALPPLRAIAVDDDPAILAYLTQILGQQNLQLTCLEDPRQFWDMLNTIQPDLLLLDLEMPYLSGIELCQHVRSDRQWVHLPIVFITACQDPDTINRIYQAGADDYLAKPLSEESLLIRVVNRLRRMQQLHP